MKKSISFILSLILLTQSLALTPRVYAADPAPTDILSTLTDAQAETLFYERLDQEAEHFFQNYKKSLAPAEVRNFYIVLKETLVRVKKLLNPKVLMAEYGRSVMMGIGAMIV